MKLFFALIGLLSCLPLDAQVTALLSVDNAYALGTEFFFDVNLRRTSPAQDGNIYLGTSDFVLEFNNGNFADSSFQSVSPSPGNCNFSPMADTGTNAIFTRDFYYQSSTSITQGKLVISVKNPSSTDQTHLNTRVAMIDDTRKHRLGTYRISGISNGQGTVGLKWAKDTQTKNSKIHSIDPDTYISTEIDFETQDAINIALPVELISFEAVAIDNEASQLSWQTASEVKSEGFEIERKKQTDQWNKIGFAPSKGTGNNDYYFIDPSPKTGTNYYRLKQIDVDGSYEYSPVASVDFEASKGLLYPNPTAGVLYIDGYPDKGYEVFDVTSKMLQQGVVNHKSIDVRTLSNGMYFLKIDGTTFRFIKW